MEWQMSGGETQGVGEERKAPLPLPREMDAVLDDVGKGEVGIEEAVEEEGITVRKGAETKD